MALVEFPVLGLTSLPDVSVDNWARIISEWHKKNPNVTGFWTLCLEYVYFSMSAKETFGKNVYTRLYRCGDFNRRRITQPPNPKAIYKDTL